MKHLGGCPTHSTCTICDPTGSFEAWASVAGRKLPLRISYSRLSHLSGAAAFMLRLCAGLPRGFVRPSTSTALVSAP